SWSLGRIGGEAALQALKDALGTEEDPEARDVIGRAAAAAEALEASEALEAPEAGQEPASPHS
ncbi:hypothetical protein BN871_DG_00010, partial [Paenibacillus sp. P22]